MIDEPDVYGRFTTGEEAAHRKQQVWRGEPMLTVGTSARCGECVTFDQMPMGCWTRWGGGVSSRADMEGDGCVVF